MIAKEFVRIVENGEADQPVTAFFTPWKIVSQIEAEFSPETDLAPDSEIEVLRRYFNGIPEISIELEFDPKDVWSIVATAKPKAWKRALSKGSFPLPDGAISISFDEIPNVKV